MFGKKKIKELEDKIRLANQQIGSLKSDLTILERENFELRARYEPQKAPGQIKSAESRLHTNAKGRQVAESNPDRHSSSTIRRPNRRSNDNSSSSDFIGGVVIGAVGMSLIDDSDACNSSE